MAKSCFSIAGSSLYVLCFIDDRFKNGHLQKYTNKGDMVGRNVNYFGFGNFSTDYSETTKIFLPTCAQGIAAGR